MTKYEEIEKFILERIKIKQYKAEEKVPSENKLAELFSVSRMTARKALDSLVTRNYLYKVKGKGTYVKDRENRYDIFLDEMIGFTKRVERTGKKPCTKVDIFEIRKPSLNTASKLGISTSEDIFYMERIRYIDDEPVILEISHMPISILPNLTKKDIENSKYSYLRSKGYEIDEMIKEYTPVIPGAHIRKTLKLDKNVASFKIELVAFLMDKKIFEYTKLYYNQSKYRFLQISKKIKS